MATLKFWGGERLESLRLLAARGLTASQIAARIGGVSRNSVIGALRRNAIRPIGGKTQDGSVIPKSQTQFPQPRQKLARYQTPRPTETWGRPCQFIAGVPTAGDDCKCMARSLLGRSFCAEHHAVVYVRDHNSKG